MPKIPYKPEKTPDDEEDYEIVSFEDFCDKSGGSKTDLLTLNDNINYRLCYESDKGSKFEYDGGGCSSRDPAQTETSLNGSKNVTKRKLSGSFAPFGRYNGKTQRGSLFGGVIPKARAEGDSGSREHRYQRFSESRNICQRVCDNLPGFGSGMLGVALVCALCVGAWWAVGGAVGGAWGEEHYRKLWERAHPDNIKKPLSPIPFEKNTPPLQVNPEYRYHDHNNLSTKNKNASVDVKKKELNKKSYLDLTPEALAQVCGQVSDNMRFDCAPGGDEAVCEKRGCCWKPAKTQGAPYCYYPPGYTTFKFLNMTENKHGMRAIYAKDRPSGYPGDFELAVVDFKYLSDDSLQIKIYDPEHKRFEVPIPQLPMVPGPISTLKYRVQLDSGSVGFKIIRNADNVTILNTQDVGAMILSDKFLQISAILPTDHIFGFGEHRDRLRRDMNWKTYTMFNRDITPIPTTNLYGTHPFYLAVEKDGKSHGLLLQNSNAIDVVLQPTPALTFRAIGGILKLLVFMGPSPKEVVSQYTELIGRPFMPPYWSLGFHLCKYGYHDLNTTERVWQSNRDAGIPFDVQWNDIDYMVNQNDFTYDTVRFGGLPEFVKKLHNEGMHYVIIIDPGVSASEKLGTYPPYDRGIEMDVFVKNSTNQPFIGKVWNYGTTVFPDFTHPNSTSYWVEMMTEFHSKVNYDGAWIDMNEPSNFVNGQVDGECLPENLSYKPAWTAPEGLKYKTLCMDAIHAAGAHYDVHNLYSLYEAVATNFALQEIRGKRPFIISRSSFPGLGHYAGHWSGDVRSTWDDMRMSIPELLSFSLFGIPMMGADICGFVQDTTPALCKRWMQLGAFYPFSRNHADINSKPQDPVSLGPAVVEASIVALRLRYRLLPYYYTLFWRAHINGDTVARPLFFESPENQKLHDIDEQFLIGQYVMVTPILDEGATTTKAFYPGPQKWYNIVTGEYIACDKYSQVGDHEMVAVKGGAILPLQEPPLTGPVTTSNTRSRPIQLLVVPDNSNMAAGQLYWDDGDSLNSYEERKYSNIEFALKDEELKSKVVWWGYGVPSINNITVLAQNFPVKAATVNGNPAQFHYTGKSKMLCETCGSKECNRHDSGITTDPWVGLQIHKQLDLAIEDFYNTILEQFINSWYSKITLQPFFIDELRHQLRYASACLLQRAIKINYSRFITERLLPCALRHYTVCAERPDAALLDSKLAVHPAAASRHAELRYLRAITNAIMPYLLKNNELENSVFRVLIREIFSGWVLLSLTDVLADPYILNTLIVLATGDETMAQLPASPNYTVEFLETFVRQTDSVYSQRPRLLRMDLETVISEQEHFYALMQYMKTTSHIHLLQFYKDIKSFQTKILNPELAPDEVSALHAEACDMYERYFATETVVPEALRPFADELEQLLHSEPNSVKRLQTSRALYQAARHSHGELEKIMLPRFLHSEEFYKLLLGSRIPTGFHKHMTRKPQEKLLHSALKLGNRIKGALKSQAIDGQVLDCFTNAEISDGDSVENMDILNFLDSIAADDREQDLSTCKVVLTNVETRLQAPPRRGTVRVFTLAVHRLSTAGARLWSVERSENDFHLLRAKLHEFHGHLLHDLPLPSRRDNSPLETLRYKYEDFLQRLLQKSLLQTSELLHLFLSVDGDFSMVVQASALSANGTDLANMYQTVAHRLRKEKGQHLETFLKNLLVCSDMERFQALKQGTTHVEEALEVSEELEPETLSVRRRNVRNIHSSIFGNNLDLEDGYIDLGVRRASLQNLVHGFTHSLVFLLTKVIRARGVVSNAVGSVLGVTKGIADDVFNGYLNTVLCALLSEKRLAHLIRLGHGLLFGKKASTPRSDPVKQRELARTQLLNSIPSSATLVLGPGLPIAVHTAFEIIQKPQLNKQLVYNLLDLCVLELFPELSATDSKLREPKS
ncbi:uncharacterized protein LOC126372833 [Pectinophora gossypiella]|uniref:uncharacterized protein LOC126372833 n=1 Tax=Pectinophora gossypiella TaxID=13191 RepID=UPI00214F2EF8|nr:uncharacterized protein LOC126372833 [Pectinophora gossypiella]